MRRRDILKGWAAISATLPFSKLWGSARGADVGPVVVSTWDHGRAANAVAWRILEKGGRALEAAEEGVKVVESDPAVTTVGYGGLPDRDGKVTLDACIMDESGNCGSVAFLEQIKNPISVARKVMEETPHVMLVGEGALQFALAKGFKRENLLTPEAEEAWRKWLETAEYKPVINIENHDTIGLIALDEKGRMAGACTTSGAAFKMHGRVGDSPLIGAGLYVDSEVGGACATGLGELVIKTVGSFLVVELMRQGSSPQKACEAAVKRIADKLPEYRSAQVGFLALSKSGEWGAFSIEPGFTFAVRTGSLEKLEQARSLL